MRHPDEGEIHAWLDGALAADEASWIEAHVAGCARCAEEVATARGLIAGASRILLALDGVPGGVIPGRATESAPGLYSAEPARASDVAGTPLRRTNATARRQVPWFSRPLTRIAAGLVLAAGVGTLAIGRDADRSNQVTIELRTEQVELTIPSPGSPALPDTFGAAIPSAAQAASGDAQGDEVTRRAAVAVPPPAAPPSGSIRSPERTASPALSATAAKVRQGAPGGAESRVAAPAPSVPASRSAAVREEERARTPAAGGAVGGAGAQARTVLADSTRAGQDLRLQNVVVTGAASPVAAASAAPPLIRMDSLAATRLNLAGDASLAGSCYALDLAAPAELARGDMPLPRTMRIRLADLQNITAYAPAGEAAAANAQQAAGIQFRARARAAERQPPTSTVAAPEPVETVEWERLARDSVVARRMAGVDVIVFRLSISDDAVTGTAAAQTATTPPVRVTGRRIACDGSY